jgi:tRNA uridine 5-carbamoylmethylation protein Kti12
MKKIIMTKGLPGSGKTYWAKQAQRTEPTTVLVNKDDLRDMLHQGAWSRDREAFVLKVRDFIVVEAIKENKPVIVHDTNLAAKHETRLRQLAKENGAEFEIKDFTWVLVDDCIRQDLMRERSVGEKVIRKMFNQFLKPKIKVQGYDASLPYCVICDLDGTLALFGDANPYDRDFMQDQINPVIKRIIDDVTEDLGKLIIVSGRTDKFAFDTGKWLEENKINFTSLYMRKEGDVRKDRIVKEEIYKEHIQGKYNVLFVLDDRNQVVDMWRSMGLICLQVADGDF